LRFRIRSLALGSAVALAAVVLPAVPAAAATALVFDCQAVPPIGSPAQITLDTAVQGTAPATVTAGGSLEVIIANDPMTVPGEAAGATITNIRNLVLKAPVPANSTVTSVKLTGGTGIGDAPPTVAVADGVITMTVPGPIPGGSTFQMPALNATAVAGNTVDAKIETKLSGTSYSDPGLTFIANVQVLNINLDVPTSCFPNPSPTFTTTTIVAAPPEA
jgi:dehydratase